MNLDGQTPAVELDERTSSTQKQIVGIIQTFLSKIFHFDLCEIRSEHANATVITIIIIDIDMKSIKLKM